MCFDDLSRLGEVLSLCSLRHSSRSRPLKPSPRSLLHRHVGAHQPYVQQGKLKVIANLSATPLAQNPYVPNLRSYGIGYEARQYFQLQGPKGMADAVRDAWAKAITDTIKSDTVGKIAGQQLLLELEHLGPQS